MTGELRTGAEVIAALTAAAAARGVPLHRFVAPLSASPGRWIKDVQQAGAPRDVTLARVRALLAGQEIPHRQKYERSGEYQGRTGSRGLSRGAALGTAITADRAPQDREPCFKCGVRGDIGCAHRRRDFA